MSDDLSILEGADSTPIEAGIAAVAKKARGYSLDDVELRGYEVCAFDFSKDVAQQKWEVLFKTGATSSGLLKAEQEAKHAFNRENDKPEEKRRAIRLRYLVSIDPTKIAEAK